MSRFDWENDKQTGLTCEPKKFAVYILRKTYTQVRYKETKSQSLRNCIPSSSVIQVHSGITVTSFHDHFVPSHFVPSFGHFVPPYSHFVPTNSHFVPRINLASNLIILDFSDNSKLMNASSVSHLHDERVTPPS